MQFLKGANIGELEVLAVAAAAKGDHAQAAKLMKQAVEREEQMGPPSGPPGLIKPPTSYLASCFCAPGSRKRLRHNSAPRYCVNQIVRVLYSALPRCRETWRPVTAEATYQKLLDQWQQADPDLPELKEAREVLTGLDAKWR